MPTQIGNIRLYSLKEITEPLKVNVLTVRRYITTGRLKGAEGRAEVVCYRGKSIGVFQQD